jgi:hypothetical protein
VQRLYVRAEEAMTDDIDNWTLDGPDADGFIWFRWEGPGPKHSFNLGERDQAAEKIAAFLAQMDFGE